MQLIIPARDEASRLPRTLDALRAHVMAAGESPAALEVIVVDNGSTDDTARLALEASTPAMPVRVVACETRGKGAAVRKGMCHTTADVVAFMDADGATRLDALVDGMRILAAGADIAVGSRAVPGAVTTERHSRTRVVGARLYRRCTRVVAPGIADTQCGFKVFRGDLARAVFGDLVTTGFSFDVELLARAQRRGARIVEFPVTWDDVPGSTFVPLTHGASAFWELALIARRVKRSSDTAEVAILTPRTPPALAPAAEA
jgi:glycosyltransferase involved in cell wall biosynthesis